MKTMITLTVFVTSFLVGLPSFAQEMPPGNMIVNTACSINDGYTFTDALDAARSFSYDGDNAPNLVFYRRPIATADTPSTFVLRVVYWDNLEHWARGSGDPGNTSARANLDEIMTCNNTNRSFFINRNVGEGGDAYAGGENNQSLSAARFCQVKPGNTLQDVYAALVAIQQPYLDQGNTTLMQLSHRFLNPGDGDEMGRNIIIRLIGETPEGLAARLDMSPKVVGLSDDAPVMNCQDRSLWATHVIRWGI